MTAILLTTFSCGQKTDALPQPTELPRDAGVVQVVAQDIDSVVSFDALVVANPEFQILADQNGSALRYLVRKGRFVRQGSVIASYRVGSDLTQVRMPANGTVLDEPLVQDAPVSKNLPLARLKLAGLGIQAQSKPELLYRLQEIGAIRVQITNGPGPFDCTSLGSAMRQDDSLSITCRPTSRDIVLYPGLSAVMAVTTGSEKNALVLPLSAVAGTAVKGTVLLQTPTGFVAKDVDLGISDGSSVQISGGLKVGDSVSSSPPNLALPSRPR